MLIGAMLWAVTGGTGFGHGRRVRATNRPAMELIGILELPTNEINYKYKPG